MSLRSLSPLDGRYAAQAAPLSPYFSEFALIRFRIQVEVEWLITLAARPEIDAVRPLTPMEADLLRKLVTRFDDEAAEVVKEIERTTNHDVKAVEYFIKRQLKGTSLEDVLEWVHFACTSEDINNLAHALMLQGGVGAVWLPRARGFVDLSLIHI